MPEETRSSVDGDLVDIGGLVRNPVLRLLLRCVCGLMEPLIRLRALNRAYRELRALDPSPERFYRAGLDILRVRYRVSEADLARIPKTGPVVIVANHPFGALDGVILGDLLQRARPDSKLLGNYLLARIRGIEPLIIEVDPFGGADAKKNNLGGMRACLAWLRGGHALGVFPSGTVSHFHARNRRVTDPPWSPTVAGLVRRSGATVVPVYFEGRNSVLFQVLGLLHPRIRTLLLPRELLGKRGCEVSLRVGHPIRPARLARFGTSDQATDYLRLKTYILRNRRIAEKTSFRFARRRRTPRTQPIPAGPPKEDMAEEVRLLPAEQLLAEQGDFAVYFARSFQIPRLLDEVGRLREITFREVGEGTGLGRDLDRFDAYYIHLFMWNRAAEEIVGAYRLGLSDEILAEHGEQGFYTATLFRYKPGVLRQLDPAVELGRSFVVAAYQRKPVSLSLIWRGIGQFIARHPRYRVLFGPVSISREYDSLSKSLIVMYLKEHSLDPELADKVRARKPPRSRSFGGLDRRSFRRAVEDIEDVSALISEIEREERGVPVLLRQYLKLNATILSFNVDPEFSDCIDGLVLVDLAKTNEKTLRRYMGDEGADRFYAFHEIRSAERRENVGI
ncbi:MAG: lysophospholipid acyltransferase family protein [Opitutales bacterium]|nr:lysophospholipid acyltransferase family protein [Opitutales bacterium]